MNRRNADIKVLVLEGTPKERGIIHGRALKTEIKKFIDRWKKDIQDSTNLDPDVYIKQLLNETDFIPAIKRWAPDLLEEVEGIAEGSGIEFDTIFARQLSDEDWWFRTEKKYNQENSIPRACSSMGVFNQKNGLTIVAQNMDTSSYWDGFQVLLHIKYPDGLETYIFTAAGGISMNGMNNRGLAISCNTILQCDYSKVGLPEVFVVRAILEKSNVEEAEAFVKSIKHASPQNYVIGDSDKVIDLEASANKVVEFTPYSDANRIYHTNHPLVNDDQGIYQDQLNRMKVEERENYLGRCTTKQRYSSLESNLGNQDKLITVDTIKDALSSKEGPVCLDIGGAGITLGCCIMELSPKIKFHLAPGPPCSTDFKTYLF